LRTAVIATLRGKKYKVHRLVWAIETGAWPERDIDHINHDKLDNRIENLRAVEHAVNQRNMSRHRHNTSGVTGVSFDKRARKWAAYIWRDQKSVRIGSFSDKRDAIAARKSAEATLGYHKNHGI
jgi:hypothetical protein